MIREKVSIDYRQINWRIPVFVISTAWSIFLVYFFFIYKGFYSGYGIDYITYWNSGKIADSSGYSEIYDRNEYIKIQIQDLEIQELHSISDHAEILNVPTSYLSFFIIPFQFLSRLDLVYGYWLWSIINLSILIGYLLFFHRKTISEYSNKNDKDFVLLIQLLLSYPVLFNFLCGQVSVFMLICTGEFIRNAIRKKATLSGIWLGGLLIKPQSLVLIIPALFFKQNRKILRGFIVSCGIIVLFSFVLSGINGFEEMIKIWIGPYLGNTFSNDSLEIMINWRMIGLNLNHIFNITFGWIFTLVGMILTILGFFFLHNRKLTIGSPSWVIMMLGVFSSNLLFTWYAFQHMAMVLIPFFIYATNNKMISKKYVFLWSTITQVVWFGMIFFGATANHSAMAVAVSGFALNLLIFLSTLKILHKKEISSFSIS